MTHIARSRRALLRRAAALAVVATLAPLTAGAQYTPYIIGSGAIGPSAGALNNLGDVAMQSGGAFKEGLLLTPSTGAFTLLGTLPGYTAAQGFAVNNNRMVVGQASSSSGLRAFRWTAATGMQDLGTLTGGTLSQATGVNSAGVVVGVSDGTVGDRAVRWTPSSGAQSLGVLAGGDFSGARAINTSGVIVGFSTSSLGFRAFRWRDGFGMESLGTLAGDIGSDARAINSFGQIVGTSNSASSSQRSFLWSDGAGMLDLGSLGGIQTSAAAINDLGQVVGSSQNALGEWRAFLWQGGTMWDLADYTGLTDWTFERAYSINDGGSILAYGCSMGRCSNVLLDGSITRVPEPATIALLGLGVLGLGVLGLVGAGRRRQTE